MVALQLVQEFKDLDINILKTIFESRNPAFDIFLRLITNSAAALAFGIPGIWLMVALIKKDQANKRRALQLLLPVALSAIIANLLKYTIDLPRPYELYPFIHKLSVGGSPSFPSGHTADAFAFATAVSLMYRKWIVVVVMLAWATFVGYTRMALGVHFPSDVLAGAVIGAMCSYAVYFYMHRKYTNPPEV